MLGENHSLVHEFPELKTRIADLMQKDPSFAAETIRYNGLDAQIRELELEDSPIDDEAMKELKLQRAALKDDLYQRLLEEGE